MLKKLPKLVRVTIASLSFVVSVFAFIYMSPTLFNWFKLQVGPEISTLFASFSVFALSLLLGQLIFAFIFGRFYCSVLCPFGILQDIIGFFSPLNKKKLSYNYPKTRYLILALSLATLAGGFSFFFLLLDPYSNFGRITSSIFSPFLVFIYDSFYPFYGPITLPNIELPFIVVGAVLPLLILVLLVIFKKRFYCTSICPVGTLLGLCAKNPILKLGINQDKCVACKLCTSACPAGCIDISKKTISDERCLRCMNCISVCPKNAVSFSLKNTINQPLTQDITRRDFLAGIAATLTVFGSSLFTGLKVKANEISSSTPICPPGAGSPERLLATCTACNLCVTACKGTCLFPTDGKYKTINLKFKDGACEFNCTECMDVCPTGALRKMPLEEKKRWRIGLAELALHKCITIIDETECGACAEVCPTGALRMIPLNDDSHAVVPNMEESLCIGCGACENICPILAVKINPIGIQVKAANPKDYLPKNENNPIDSNEWLF